ncbi:recombinase family protein [Flavobacterium muglaense]|uniref:Recombinase family protein n=1 Tax=Flavobacterium muglaense TaxID=2764716 RepID=A0A923MX35_9FLAO|nr:recombinase family protein [Flavobacterium muglaense]MBC5836771.1 recombinase family protein [Flavobacterium muglaense]MBC5843279.1 recombinase family protein [Flavobacterium muglaense]
MKNHHAILLVRVSTEIQDYQAQIYDLEQYGKSLGYTHFKVIETKETAFADLSQKVGTNQMFQFQEQNPEYNTILITELSRLARRQSILHQIKEHCENNQIQIYIKDLNFKLLDDDGKINQQSEMIFTLYGMFSESEVKQKLERFQRKRKELMAQGLSIGGKILFGYDRFLIPEINKNTLILNDEQATIVRQIFNWYLNGLTSTNNPTIVNPSIKSISIECVKRGCHKYTHSKRNVNKLLKEQAYTGEKVTNNKRKNPKFGIVSNAPEYLVSSTKIKYVPIIDVDTFEKVQAKLKSNIINSDKETKHITLLSKILNCPACGRKLGGNYRIRKDGAKNSYRCTSRTDTQSCSSVGKSLSMNLIDSAVWQLIKLDLPALSKKINEINPDEYLLEMDNHLSNLIQREKEIQNNIDENVAILKSVGKLSSAGVLTLIETTGKKIEKLENDYNKIQQEKSKIESNKLLIFDKQGDVESIINDNLSTIESDKELLKKYINIFIDDINIIQHNVQYTVLELIIKDGTTYGLLTNPEIYSQRNCKNIEVNYLIIDKKITQQPKISFMKVSGNVDINFHRETVIPNHIPNIKKWNVLNKLNL